MSEVLDASLLTTLLHLGFDPLYSLDHLFNVASLLLGLGFKLIEYSSSSGWLSETMGKVFEQKPFVPLK